MVTVKQFLYSKLKMNKFHITFKELSKHLIIFAIIIVLTICVVFSQISLLLIGFMSSDIKNPITECNSNSYVIRNDRSVWLFCSFLALISSNFIYFAETILLWRFRSHTIPQSFTDFILVSKKYFYINKIIKLKYFKFLIKIY